MVVLVPFPIRLCGITHGGRRATPLSPGNWKPAHVLILSASLETAQPNLWSDVDRSCFTPPTLTYPKITPLSYTQETTVTAPSLADSRQNCTMYPEIADPGLHRPLRSRGELQVTAKTFVGGMVSVVANATASGFQSTVVQPVSCEVSAGSPR